jgi:D-glycero-alpha-D-manno-heptose-7-phosphate kinase
MIISMTPLRVSFFGGGTDYPDYYLSQGGAVLATGIDKYVYLMVSPLTRFSEHRIRISYSITELCHSVDEIKHPSVRECLRFMGIDGGLEINVASDLPARTGLGSSSAFTVGLLHALYAYKGKQVSAQQLAEEAVHGGLWRLDTSAFSAWGECAGQAGADPETDARIASGSPDALLHWATTIGP